MFGLRFASAAKRFKGNRKKSEACNRQFVQGDALHVVRIAWVAGDPHGTLAEKDEKASQNILLILWADRFRTAMNVNSN